VLKLIEFLKFEVNVVFLKFLLLTGFWILGVRDFSMHLAVIKYTSEIFNFSQFISENKKQRNKIVNNNIKNLIIF
jgi:hypothetical protein